MPDNNKNGRKPSPGEKPEGSGAPLTELDFESFLSDAPEPEPRIDDSFKSDIEATEKSLEDDIRELYEEIMSHPLSTDEPVLSPNKTEPDEQPTEAVVNGMWLNPDDYYNEPQQASPFARDYESSPVEASPDEPGVSFNPSPAQERSAAPVPEEVPVEEDFSAVIAGALNELDSLIDDIYSDSPVQKIDKAPPAMEDISSVSEETDFDEPTESLGIVSPDELDSLSPVSVPKQPASPPVTKGEDYFLGRAPATAPRSADASADATARRPSQRPTSNYVTDTKKTSAFFPAKGDSKGEIFRKIVLMVSIVTIIVSSGILVNSYFIEPYRFSVQADKALDDLIAVDDSGNIPDADMSAVSAKNPDVVYPEGLQKKYYKLYAANDDLAGWINIPALQINLPLAQGKDNQYYLKRDVYGKRTKYGVPFFDYRNSLRVLNRNTIIYGHNMEYDDLIFGMLENYRSIEGYKSAPVIECNTIFADYTWLVYGAFVTNGEKKSDNGYVFNYNFTELDNYTFLEYIKQVDQRKLYTTGVDILSTDKILTLSTCCYDFNGARLVVIARLLREGESVHVSTANTVINPNPRYPQAWYDAQNKTNPYAKAEKWVAYADLTKTSN